MEGCRGSPRTCWGWPVGTRGGRWSPGSWCQQRQALARQGVAHQEGHATGTPTAGLVDVGAANEPRRWALRCLHPCRGAMSGRCCASRKARAILKGEGPEGMSCQITTRPSSSVPEFLWNSPQRVISTERSLRNGRAVLSDSLQADRFNSPHRAWRGTFSRGGVVLVSVVLAATPCCRVPICNQSPNTATRCGPHRWGQERPQCLLLSSGILLDVLMRTSVHRFLQTTPYTCGASCAVGGTTLTTTGVVHAPSVRTTFSMKRQGCVRVTAKHPLENRNTGTITNSTRSAASHGLTWTN
ncbi:hypothetical protein Tc00.1047053506703.120 [Trypanosoma cruzi]|uniref:Uncharacterized protein n=1 Tax=Trypanosoma cruzi (strain CL Brener) TaxID=353153 RepID=Q4DD85_TRYCC|nr:hypothetical protein Tc00.1047053506703.120 [Trypanosoma cruzi]EAN90490.1 hypothetical protein Tc00.1047053506703.120 [Trypanosoma cruzi]|eukprot:XP_812341.1 hypothetical protein [Trypanosoma cruzi strain CL Brener]